MMRKVLFSHGQLRPFWAIALFLAIVISLRVAQYFVFTSHLPDGSFTQPAGLLSEEVIRAGIVILATWMLARIEGRPWTSYGLSGPSRLKLMASGSAMGFITLSVLVAVLYMAGYARFSMEPTPVLQLVGSGAVWLLAFFAVAVFEELLLRGYIQYKLGEKLGFWWAALVWSVLFMAMHVSNAGENLVGVLQTGWVALFFCLSLRVTGSLWWAIGFHALWDWGESFFYGTPNSATRFSHRLMTATAHGNAWWSGGSVGPEGSLLSLFVLVIPLAWLAWVWHRKTRSVRKSCGTGEGSH